MNKEKNIEELKSILDVHLQLPLDKLHTNTEYNLQQIEINSKVLEKHLTNQINDLLKDKIIEGQEYDLFTKGAIIGSILALKDIRYILNHEKRLKK